jgi:pyrimidine operon attenuation protein/uracil phosphoribosyltransferase
MDFNVAVCLCCRQKVQGQQEVLKLKGTHHLLVLVDDIILLGKCIRGKL